MFFDFKNKRPRPEKMQWIYDTFKDLKLRTAEYVHYGIEYYPSLTEENKRTILAELAKNYEYLGHGDPRVQAANILRRGMINCGFDVTDKEITEVYNLAPNIFSRRW